MTNLSFVRQVTAAALSVLLCSNLWAASSDTLAPRQRAIVAIAAHTANGDLNALERNLVEGLQAGLTVNEIKEVLIQLYAYTGFPRSLNAIHTFMRVMDERAKAGIKDPVGKNLRPLPPISTKTNTEPKSAPSWAVAPKFHLRPVISSLLPESTRSSKNISFATSSFATTSTLRAANWRPSARWAA